MSSSPLSTFSITKLLELRSDLFNISISLTNNSFYLIIGVLLTILLLTQSNDYLGNRIVPSNLGLVGESIHSSLLNMSRNASGNQTMLPLLLALFMLILMANLLSNIPYNYASTSALTFTLGLSFTVFIGVTLLAISIKKWVFLATFVPAGTPSALLPILVLIELVSYCARAISLGVRLFANIVAGHTLLNIISTMSNQVMLKYWFFIGILISIMPLILLIALVGLEIAVAFIQAYVFVILTAIYLNEAIKPLSH